MIPITSLLSNEIEDDLQEPEAPRRVCRAVNLGPLPSFTPEVLGPTWSSDPNDPDRWLLPEFTLGYAVIAWCAYWLNGAGGAKRWQFTNEQARFVLWFYAVDRTGAWLARENVLQRVKGWGLGQGPSRRGAVRRRARRAVPGRRVAHA